MATALQTLTSKLADRFDMGDGIGLSETLKGTAFAGANVNDAQMVALLGQKRFTHSLVEMVVLRRL